MDKTIVAKEVIDSLRQAAFWASPREAAENVMALLYHHLDSDDRMKVREHVEELVVLLRKCH